MAGTSEADRSPSRPIAESRSVNSAHPTNAFVHFERGDIEQSIPDRFEELARRFPDKVAVKTTRDALTYAQLDAVANRIAHLILAKRGNRNEAVALLFGQSVLLVASILGCLKAGKIYVPLDPLGPAPRTIDILADSTAAVILTDSTHFDHAREFAPLDVSVLNADTMEDVESAENPGLAFAPERLAYIFYTSGSTGKPKGLADTHRNVLHNIMRYTNSLHIRAADRLTLLQSASFSGSVSSLFCALLNGATSFPFSLQHEGPDRLASWVSQECITIYHSVPSIFRLLATGKHSYPALRVIRLEGDQASPRDIELYKTYFRDTCVLVNGLGATECGLVRQYFVNKDTPIPESVVPIGYAVEDMEVFLLDDANQPVGFDCVGEIAVRSRYLAPGYWRRADLTDAAFVADPQGGLERTYRMGDLGRMHADGCLEYLGRNNFQLRIRGQWVEIPEIEKVLNGLGVFKEVVVVAMPDKSSEPRLVAYLVPAASSPPAIDEIRRHLARRLPLHMIPSAFIILDAIPLNAYGKIDRRALLPPDRTQPVLDGGFVPPRTPIECALADIWREVLGLERVSIHDDFFDLGGHSLLAFQVVSRIFSTFHVELPPRTVFEAPTVGGLAGAVVQGLAMSAGEGELAGVLDGPDGAGNGTTRQGGTSESYRGRELDMSGQTGSGPEFFSGQRRIPHSVGPTTDFREFKKEEIERSIPHRFEQEVAAHPDRLAVRSRNHELTYGRLNEAANRVAHAILAQRGTIEEPIALLLEHDAPMLSAMVGALKAGKICVPLDRSHPFVRCQHILKDSEATLIITDHRNLTLAREMALGGCPVIDVEELDARYSSENPRLSLSPDTRAWILYTSGSTGQPKGVVQTHRNVLHFTRIYTNSLHICADDRLSLVYSFCTNAAAHEIYTALLNGASLFPLNIKEAGVARLPDWLVQHKITIFSAVPTVFRHFCKSLTGNAVFPHVRVIKLVGELVYKQDVEFYKKYFSEDCTLVNRLGSTETGTIRWYFIDKETRITGNIVPVGYAVEDNEILLIGETSEEDGASRVGEIAVKSRYLSPGYWRRPDLTRVAFLPDPHGGDERIYRTGDLGRMLPDGCLVHLGRKDFQVKIKGHRIEAGEVEMALAALPTVKEAAVVASKDRSGDQRLVAYVVPEGETAPTVTALRRALAMRLSEHMIPSVFVTLDSLPKAPNGKVSVGALPAPGRARPELDNPIMPPRTPVEDVVCAIWAAVLDLDEVGIHDDFLALGGHSLAASQVIARVAETFHVDLPLSTLFDTPTVEGVAAAIAVSLARNPERAAQERLLTELEALSDAEAERLLTFPKPETREHTRE